MIMWELLGIIDEQVKKILSGVTILLLGFLLGLIVKKILRKLLGEIELDKISEKLGKNYSLERRLSGVGAYLIYFITLILFLNQLGIEWIVLYIILGVLLLFMGATFLLGIKDFIPNLIAGIIIFRRGKFKKGKSIKVNGMIQGKIKKIGFLDLEVETKKKDVIYVPNSLLLKSKVWLK